MERNNFRTYPQTPEEIQYEIEYARKIKEMEEALYTEVLEEIKKATSRIKEQIKEELTK